MKRWLIVTLFVTIINVIGICQITKNPTYKFLVIDSKGEIIPIEKIKVESEHSKGEGQNAVADKILTSKDKYFLNRGGDFESELGERLEKASKNGFFYIEYNGVDTIKFYKTTLYYENKRMLILMPVLAAFSYYWWEFDFLPGKVLQYRFNPEGEHKYTISNLED